tara:strand:- start:540 stop:710 length:171 start_codon:yes stop_codon:yes gene_type:complete
LTRRAKKGYLGPGSRYGSKKKKKRKRRNKIDPTGQVDVAKEIQRLARLGSLGFIRT